MAYADSSQIPPRRVPPPFERELKVVMSPETHEDVTDFTLLVSTLAPRGGGTDLHSHEGSGELMVVTRGHGRGWLAGREVELKPGAAMYAPPGVEHRTLNDGDEPLELMCVFVPPAPPDYIARMMPS
ncbi:MAG: cupin domain-containing protein [Actinobacteria bacterium]|nr:cupin domain-containing protein [Actinomycetota bacterium]MBU1944902.1 cupin domain-containing protein [Actinomycetota bacterium]MBU2688106.1 cupin domain-containing protein [Actinomycetota bacterium]